MPQQQDERTYVCTLVSQEHILNRVIVVADNVFKALLKIASRFGNNRDDLPTLAIKTDIADVIQ